MIKIIENTINKIDNLIKEQLPESKYQFELFDLGTNTKHFRGLDEPFHWGSVYKLFVVAEIIKMAEEGLLNLDDELILHKEKYKNGNGIVKFFSDDFKINYVDACKMVIATSDNLCSDELLEIVGLERLNQLFINVGSNNSKLSLNLDTLIKELFEQIGLTHSVKNYLTPDYFRKINQALDTKLLQNYTTVTDLNNCFQFLTKDYFTDRNLTLFMDCIKVKNQHTRLSRYLDYSSFQLAGKTGSLGFGVAKNETTAIIKKTTNEIVGYFSINTKDIKKRYFETADIFGLIGLEIAGLYEELENLK